MSKAPKIPVYTTVDGDGKKQTYEGFWPPYVKTDGHPRSLAIVLVDGEPELWGLYSGNHEIAISPTCTANAVEELTRFYRAEKQRDVRIAIFRRTMIIEEDGSIGD